MKKDVSERHNLPGRFLLYVGSIEERKNLLLAVKAVAMTLEKSNLYFKEKVG